MLDANEHVNDRNSGLSQLLKIGMVDLHATRHDVTNEPATYKFGKRRIDYILGTPAIATHVIAAGIDPLYNGVFTDHRGIFVDIELNDLLKGTIQVWPSPSVRDLESKNPKSVEKYITHLLKYFEDQNVEGRLNRLANGRTLLAQSKK